MRDEEVKKVIDIKFPYYYKHDLMSDYGKSIIYGKILKDCEYTIHESDYYNNKKIFELEENDRNDYYFSSEYKSTKKEYEKAKFRALKFLNYL